MPSLRLYSLKTHTEDPPRTLIHTPNDVLHRVFAEGRELLKSDLPPVEVETQSSPELQWETPICEQLWRREWQSTPVFLSGESHRQRSLAGCAQAWKPSSQHAGEKRGVAGLLLGRTDKDGEALNSQ